MILRALEQEFAICKIENLEQINFHASLYFISKTDEELSLVCPADSIPSQPLACEKGWNMFRVQGQLDFSLVGILSKIASILAENSISIFTVSTYNTDYILVKKEKFSLAKHVLEEQGFSFFADRPILEKDKQKEH